MSNSLVRFLDWDSDFFGVRIARIIPDNIDEQQLQKIKKWCENNRIECLYFLADPDKTSSIETATQNGFKLVDARITFSLQVQINYSESQSQRFDIRPAINSDIPQLKKIASASHRDSRFYADSNFEQNRCDALFATWIEKSCNGYADIAFVAEHENKPTGYITCNILKKKKGEIGLLAVSEHYHGKGLGTALMNKAITWFIDNRANIVTVNTQERNEQAVAFYKKFGFEVFSKRLWLHQWYIR